MATPSMPERYLCPITTEIMVDPVMDYHGHNFERAAIVEWLERSANCPLSREDLQVGALYPNLALKEEIAEWLASLHPVLAAAPTVSNSHSPSTSMDEPSMPSSSPEQPPAWTAPWEKLDVDQDYYDRLLAIFLAFGSGELSKQKLQILCRYMNFVDALEHLSELLPDDRISQPTVSFEQFIAFVQKHPPCPVLDYGLSETEYAAMLKKFQALDSGAEGQVSRDIALTLVEDLDLRLVSNDLSPPSSLPETVTLHDLLLWGKRCRLLVARRCSTLGTPQPAAARQDPCCLSLEHWMFPNIPRTSPGAGSHPTASHGSRSTRSVAVAEGVASQPADNNPSLASRRAFVRGASPPRVLSKPSAATTAITTTTATTSSSPSSPRPHTQGPPLVCSGKPLTLETQRLAKELSRPMSARTPKKSSFVASPPSPSSLPLSKKSSFVMRPPPTLQQPLRDAREDTGRRRSAEGLPKRSSFRSASRYPQSLAKQASFSFGPRATPATRPPTSPDLTRQTTSTSSPWASPQSPRSPQDPATQPSFATAFRSPALPKGEVHNCLLSDFGLEELLSPLMGVESVLPTAAGLPRPSDQLRSN
eukprot:GGOE01010383.1.p1 GENE.GGOE01010383.1~~GGOE01010383.1.p1  ORF type:complete len:604 (-),score=150.63 GGOE01010383.1:485-2254(-)